MDIHTVTTIAVQELKITIRNKWTLIFALVFGVLSLAIAYFGLVTAGVAGFQGFTRTTASLLNLVLYLVPIVALMMGTLSFADNRSAGEMLFAQPLTRSEILLGKVVGLFLSMLAATFFGFGLSGLVIAAKAGTVGVTRYLAFVGLALVLALVFLILGAMVAVLSKSKTKAFGYSLFLWFFFVLFYDLLVIGLTFVFKERTANLFVFLSLFGNPVDMTRVSGLIILDGKTIFGAAGAMLLKFLGGERACLTLLPCGLLIWATVPLLIAQRLLRRLDI
jgi:Cu-processing system permease protein